MIEIGFKKKDKKRKPKDTPTIKPGELNKQYIIFYINIIILLTPYTFLFKHRLFWHPITYIIVSC